MTRSQQLLIIFGGILLLGALALSIRTQANDAVALGTGVLGALLLVVGAVRR